MAVCIYCAQAEGPMARKNEADFKDSDECKGCVHHSVWALFEDNHVGVEGTDYDHEHDADCPCVVCVYFYDTYDEYDEVQPTVQGLWDSIPHHILNNFAHRVEHLLSLRPQPVENIHPGQLQMFDDESPA